MTTRLQRSRSDRKLAGVAGGLAQYFGIDPMLVRLAFVLLIFAPHSIIVPIYLILWIVMPEEPVTQQPAAAEPHRCDPYTGQPIQ
ncbi:MAG: PspC domain-containing protein [Chloroflexales bacterium]|nr:PspC domain-containing protein [Chloroflexales bacterium]